MQSLTVLVLGVGGNVSQGILKALAISSLRCRVIGACISPLSIGLYTVDRAYVSPPANDSNFMDWLTGLCRAERIDAVLSGVEPVLSVLSHHAKTLQDDTGAMCIVSPPACLAIGDDKLMTCQWLKDRGFPFPQFADTCDLRSVEDLVRSCGFPLIAKPRRGKGAAGILELHNDRELEAIAKRPGYVIQQYLGHKSDEYTVGCFSDRKSSVRGAIVFRRDLFEGTTYRAQAGHFPDVRSEAVRIAEALRPLGPSNMQMRIHEGVPVCFEINVRFSGTTPIRARFGFNDVEAALRHYILDEPATDLPVITEGTALRYWNEAYIDAHATAELRQRSRLDEPKQFPLLVETYGIRQ